MQENIVANAIGRLLVTFAFTN